MVRTAYRGWVKRIAYPDELPISARVDEISDALGAHQVVIVAGETGSGKSTQLPKICLDLGRGADGKLIGHTQPRRLAARTVAERVAEELGTRVGGEVGYTVRFTDQVGPATAGEGHDRRDSSGRDPARPAIRPLRHPDHRRGPRAEPQRRFPARVLHPALAPAARSQADHHVGHDRHRTLRPPLRRPGHRGVGSDLPGRDALPAPRERRRTARSGSARRHLRCRRGAAARRAGRHPGVLQW